MLLTIALVLDMVFAEPKWLWSRAPHPAVLMGRCVALLEQKFNTGTDKKRKGIMVTGLLCLLAGITGYILSLTAITECLALFVLLAHGSLIQHVSAVARGLYTSLTNGRQEVAKIVGRDTSVLDKSGVSRAAIESCAENFSDGVVAPVFWYLVAGVPGLLIYKIINTADSMIGHKTERYQDFGWAAARLDDALNIVPARLTGALICLAKLNLTAFKTMIRDARLHRSPNAGWPEAAMAACLGLKLGGSRHYSGEEPVEAPWLNDGGCENATPDDIDRCIRIINTAWLMMLALSATSFATL